jgi:adenosylcobyric acid synthase
MLGMSIPPSCVAAVKGLLAAGTASDAGRSVVVAGICRWLARRGVKVAPFKAQNMALNSAVTPDGAEIGRAQAAQAQAGGVVAEAAMNPILLKPSGERTSQVVVMGEAVTELDAHGYQALKPRLRAVVLDALASLAERFEVWSAKAPAARPRSTCAPATWSTWAWPGRRCVPARASPASPP